MPPPEYLTCTARELNLMSLKELQKLASLVGVGYADLGEAALRDRLVQLGTPV